MLLALYPTVNLKSFSCNGKGPQQNLTYVGRCLLFSKCWGHWHCHNLQLACPLFSR